MTDREKPEFMKLLISTADLYKQELSSDVVELWWNALKSPGTRVLWPEILSQVPMKYGGPASLF